ncbi:uncharacterized protein LOC106179520 [Lingula anatina]|uniref:Uncharacterized protein LOC106179520 n=1 Tax=Lingula anatina TaxID=7574 RepID=A0A1S3K817_LINAN|nr:uncharacterized protein LOC106179520 [Lingula anatina]|eukprot:XP_013418637.1 uncharacterized protein LOC106179520 [Lingula anatina]
MNRLIRLITFDVNKTMIKVRGSPGLQYANIAKACGIDVDVNTLDTAFLGAYKNESIQHPNFGKQQGLSDYQWWSNVVHNSFHVAGIFDTDPVLVDIADKLYRHFLTAESWEVLPNTVEVLTTLKEKNYQLGVISNFDSRLQAVLAALSLDQYFDFVVTSVEAGGSKPHPQPFQLALKLAGDTCLSPSHALHVGDSYEKDYQAARKLGWNACLISNQNDTHISQAVQPLFVIKDLRDLISFVDGLEKDKNILTDENSTVNSESSLAESSEQSKCGNSNGEAEVLGAVVMETSSSHDIRKEDTGELKKIMTSPSEDPVSTRIEIHDTVPESFDGISALDCTSENGGKVEFSDLKRSQIGMTEVSDLDKTEASELDETEANDKEKRRGSKSRVEKWLPHLMWILTRKEHPVIARCPSCRATIRKGDLHIALKSLWIPKKNAKEDRKPIQRVYRYCVRRRCTQFPPQGSDVPGLDGKARMVDIYIDPLLELTEEEICRVKKMGFKTEEMPSKIGMKTLQKNKHLAKFEKK